MALQLGHLFQRPSGTAAFLLDASVLIVEETIFSNQLIANTVEIYHCAF